MIEYYNLLLLMVGIAFLFGAFFVYFPKKLPVSLPMMLVVFGMLIGYFVKGLPAFNPLNYSVEIEKVTELVVLLSLVGCGIKLDSPLRWKTWRPAVRLLAVTMPLCILAMVVMGYYVFGLSIAAAVLLGAALAPTDPVLAASIQVGPPNQNEDEDVTRFSLTAEAGLNDGLAFPFVFLALALAASANQNQGFDLHDWLHWFGVDVVWKIGVGVGVGFLVGKFLAKCLFSQKNPGCVQQGFMVIALMLIAYGLSELVHGYGFLGVFIASLTFRRQEADNKYHEKLHNFAEQTEGLFMALVMVFLGLLLGQIFASSANVTWQVYVVSLVFLLLVRPIAGVLGLIDLPMSWSERLVTGGLGIRGIGTFYYIAYTINQDLFSDNEEIKIWVICVVTVALSVFIHGLTANRLLKMTK